ncbi:hypothetical protein LPUS_08649 [Lasallia pustulata]|uniref:DUF7704 domain-containing protein n=1 Tax=Lasallia pustulata TaxID=136370 RepID=A0A1W5D5V2_9LECA|nr:hypothetical protein LPUS_08649 [Lasallia pustulata]
MTTILPPFPRFVFTIFEPLSCTAGFLAPILNLPHFIHSQIPVPLSALPPPITPTTRLIALQLGNLYGLLALVGLAVLYTTTEPKVVRNYIAALAIADVGHLVVTGLGLGWEGFLDVRGWNDMAWGNVGVTTGLFVTRVGYLIGLFGEDRVPGAKGKKRI